MTSRSDERIQKTLRGLLQLPGNKKCADCSSKGPVYANITFNTFVCTTCSGIHREFNHRVKSISMATFKPEEVKALQEGGNEVARQKWLALWSSDDFPEPAAGDQEAIRRFIALKYIDQKWVVKPNHTKHSKNNDIPKAEPLTKILGNDIPPMKVHSNRKYETSESNHGKPSVNFANFEEQSDENPFSQPSPNRNPAPSSNNDLFDLFSPQPPKTQQTDSFFASTSSQTPKQSNNLFASPPSQFASQTTQPSNSFFNTPPPQQSGGAQVDLKQQLNALYQQQAIQNQQLYMQRQMQMNQNPQIFQMNPQMSQMNPQMSQMNPQMFQVNPQMPVTTGSYPIPFPRNMPVQSTPAMSISPTGIPQTNMYVPSQQPQTTQKKEPEIDPFADISPFKSNSFPSKAPEQQKPAQQSQELNPFF